MHPFDWQALGSDLFGSNSTQILWYLDKILRPVVVYLLLVLALRKIGLRILAQLNPFDFVVLLMLSNTVQNAIIGKDDSLWGGLVGAAALLGINYLLVIYYYPGPTLKSPIDENGGAVYLIREHKLQEPAMRRLRINVGELTARVHERGFDSLDEIECAVLYPNGTMYIKGESEDSARIADMLEQLKALRSEVAALSAR